MIKKRREIHDYVKKHPLESRKSVGKRFDTSKSTVGRIMKQFKNATTDEPKPTEVPRFLVTPTTVIVVINDKPMSVKSDHRFFQRIIDALDASDWETAIRLVNTKDTIEKYSHGRIMVQDGLLQFDGTELHHVLADRIVNGLSEGIDVDKYANFLDNLMDNPSYKSVNQLWGFLEHNDIEITDDGCFLAFKAVRSNFMDHHTGTISNAIGKTVEMPRNQVEDDPTKTCSAGLHVCAEHYLGLYGGGGVKIICKVNPKDVVSVLTDYKNAKMRVCKYEVLSKK
ncbi:MAG: hypothetical protein KAS32_23805 [Candidatus Peribacteraceae bacterium]|nr:hypothetical protein [Candidatus Peribacteraceae bacterium]